MIAVDSIDSITFSKPRSMFVHLKDSSVIDFNNVDSVTICEAVSDTIYIMYCGKHAFISNPHADAAYTFLNDSNADVFVKIKEKYSTPIVSISGNTTDGRLCIDSEVDYTLVLNGVNIMSSHAPAINSISKHKATLILEEGTDNALSDANLYVFSDSSETSSGCFNTHGALAIAGKGCLKIYGNMKHALYAKKTISIKDGTLAIPYAVSDAIHSGKNVNIEGGNLQLLGMQGDGIDLDDDFTMTEGCIEMNIEGEAAKGIKCGKLMNIEGGTITATASGALKNKKGDLAYCIIMKCDSSMTITGGNFHLVNNSPGGKCISAAHKLEISGGCFYLETSGDGTEYNNAEGKTDYYTSKCITADDTLCILRGSLQCLSTGVGGKGIVGGKYTQFGLETDTIYQQGPSIVVETTNSSIVDDVEEDERYGCPKAIKANENLYVYSGDIHATTHGMGGEGIECGGIMSVYGGNIECYTFDDGINVEFKMDIFSGNIYCQSTNNDGIDSNGKVAILDGVVVAVSEHLGDESFDTEKGNLHIFGGIVMGIGKDAVRIGEAGQLYYATHRSFSEITNERITDIALHPGYVNVGDNEGNVIMSMFNPVDAENCYILFSHPNLKENAEYTISENNSKPIDGVPLFNDNFIIEGKVKVDRIVNIVNVTNESY